MKRMCDAHVGVGRMSHPALLRAVTPVYATVDIVSDMRAFRCLLMAVVTVAAPSAAYAQCHSISDDEANEYIWTYYEDRRYTLCYSADYAEDYGFTRHWLNNTFRIGVTKYGVVLPVDRRGHELTITVFLMPERTSHASAYKATVRCCPDSSSLEIFLLTPSHEDWDIWPSRYGGGRHTFIRLLTHEMMNALHYDVRDRYQYGRDQQIPRWVLEGLAEYEGYFSTTASNRRWAEEVLITHGYERLRDEIHYGRTLLSRGATVVSTDRYAGSAIIMWNFAEQLGEESHLDLFRMSVRDVIYLHDSNPLLFFNQMRAWLERKYKALHNPTRSSAGLPSQP